VPKGLRLRHVQTLDIKERAAQWWERLAEDESDTVPALELYAGGHWSVVRRLPESAAVHGLRASLWAISAGYGLVPVSAPLHAYSATFAPGHPDSVNGLGRVERQTWWQALAKKRGPERGSPRSVADLVSRDSKATLLIIASAHYIAALEADLARAASLMARPAEMLIVTTPGKTARGPLGSCVIETPARWQAILGGARTSLHARLAERIISEAAEGFSADSVRARLQRLLERSPSVARDPRPRMTDDEVKRFIREALTSNPAAKQTGLLRALRDSGRACEQGRFKELFLEISGRKS
jgi:hypothetical protein